MDINDKYIFINGKYNKYFLMDELIYGFLFGNNLFMFSNVSLYCKLACLPPSDY